MAVSADQPLGPTVKKLLEQKRKRDTSSASSSSSPAESCAGATALPVSTPAQTTVTDASSSYSSIMGAMGPMPTSGYNRWSAPSSLQPLQEDCTFSPMGSGYFSLPSAQDYSPSQAYSPAISSSFSTQPTQEYSAAMSVHAYPGGAATSSLMGAGHADSLQPPGYSWVPASGLHTQTTPATAGFAGHINTETLNEARLFLRGMDNSKKIWQDEDGDTILHIYAAKGLREHTLAAAENLQALGRLDSKEHKGKTALLVAVTANQSEIVQDLLSLGADINACDVKGQTALHLAATYGFPRVMQTILSFGLVDLEARNFEGQTPLHCAAISHSGTVKALGSGQPAMGDSILLTPAEDKLSCLQLLISYGASLLSQDIKSNKTALHLAVKEGNIHLVRYLLRLSLVDMQAFVNMKAHGNTALHMAAGLHSSCFQEEMIRLLLNRGADPSIRNLENEQPAHLLQSGDRGEQLKLILKKRPASSRRRITSLQDQE
ncbi:NF-kappa-B inhibitor delta [Conger conger]|uniref:NF-kappa-B inhibitor delta n=1 Tax=Conger conger TaxID=82655 RepID=UPI002A5AA9E9|nr:NF-kappa-B inhibitor delta [Conger conger]